MKPYHTHWGKDVDQMLKRADELDKKAKGKMALVIAIGAPHGKKAPKEEEEGKVEKELAPNYENKEGSTIGPSHFVTETGGQTQTAHYWTNNYTLEAEDVKRSVPKGESSKALDNHNQHFPTNQSTLGSHVIDNDTLSTAVSKEYILKRIGQSLF